MKVLIIITHGKIGGATNSIFWLAKGLKEKGEEIKVAFGEGNYLEEKLEKEKIPYINFKWLKRSYNPLVNLFFIFELKKFLDKEKFDVVHFNSTNALFGAIGTKFSKNKPKTIFTFHGLSILDPNYKKNIFLKPLFFFMFKFLLHFIDISVFVSQQNFDWAKKIKLISRGVVIYNGIFAPKFLSKEEAIKFFEKKINLSLKNKFIIGSIGRLDYAKNYEFLIEIFPEILKIKNGAILIIIGEGTERKKLINLIKQLKLENNVFLLGEIKNASKYLKGFDLFVLSSRYEGLSITLIETLFAEIPILASDVGGNKEIVGKESVYKLNDKKDFSEKLQEVIHNKIEFQNYKLKEKFIIENTIENYIKIYKSHFSHHN